MNMDDGNFCQRDELPFKFLTVKVVAGVNYSDHG